jgi:hypothetical protein
VEVVVVVEAKNNNGGQQQHMADPTKQATAVVSLSPDDFIEGGAVPSDQNLRIVTARFKLWDYNGKAKTTTALELVLQGDAEGDVHTQYYSVSGPDRFAPSADGKRLVVTGPAEKLVKSSNYAVLANNLVSAGFPKNRLSEGDASVLDGTYAYWVAVAAPKRVGLDKAPTEGGEDRQKVVLVPKQILELPGQQKAAGKKPTGAKKSAAAAAAATAAPAEESADDGADITTQAVAFVQALVAEKGTVTKAAVASRVFQDLLDDPNKDAIAAMIFTPQFAAALTAAGLKITGLSISK